MIATAKSGHAGIYRCMNKSDIIQGDCLEILPTLTAHSFDVVVTSCPYNLGIDYKTYKDNLPYEDYLDWTDRWLALVARVLTHDGSLFVNVADLPRNLNLSSDLAHLAQRHLTLQNKIMWCKSVHVKGRTHGHHRPTTSPRYLDVTHEHIFHLTHKGAVPLDRHGEGVGVPYTDKANETRYKHRNKLRCPGSVWFVPQPTITGGMRDKHPATFPVKLAEKCIRLHGVREGMKVLDPFGGIGSTGVACKSIGVDCTLIEIDPEYCEVARRRIEAASAKVQMMMF